MIPPGPFAVVPLPKPPRLAWRVPGSKSITNRALILAALAEGESVLEGVLESDAPRHTATRLRALGIEVSQVAFEAHGGMRWRVLGGRSRLRAPEGEILATSGPAAARAAQRGGTWHIPR